jgi:hypothetical protein
LINLSWSEAATAAEAEAATAAVAVAAGVAVADFSLTTRQKYYRKSGGHVLLFRDEEED